MIIALEAASADQSAALADASGALLAHVAWSAPRGQGSEILPRLLGLLEGRNATLHDVEGVAVGLGPGSFTGLRVGLALAKGLASGLQVPIAGVPSLEAWLDAAPEATAAVVRAGAAEAWVRSREDPQPRLIAFETISSSGRDVPVVAARDLTTALALSRAVPPDGAAAAIARRAAERFAAGTADDLAALEPIYLRPPRGLADATAPIIWL